MDCLMPVMDGQEAMRELRRREQNNESRNIPVIVVMANEYLRIGQSRCQSRGYGQRAARPRGIPHGYADGV